MYKLSALYLAFAASFTTAAQTCSSGSISKPTLFNGRITSLKATQVNDFDLGGGTSVSFCNVSLTYTHPGEGDNINVQVWLPTKLGWNSRFQGVGGGGWTTGLTPSSMGAAVNAGYAAGGTDGGHNGSLPTDTWALLSPGNVNLYLLQDFASVALNDMTVLGKQVTENFYGKKIKKSYWNGCSTGGRQGLMLAQRYPDAYDGILAQSPAINWNPFTMGQFWPYQAMRDVGYVPSPCELNALRNASIEACDELDGLKDGVIGAPGLCKFNPFSVVGKRYTCDGGADGKSGRISRAGATVAMKFWQGARSATGAFEWFGYAHDSAVDSTANTTCSSNGKCVGVPFAIAEDWIRLFVQKDANFDPTKMSQAEFDTVYHKAIQEYDSIIGTSDPDLSRFKAGGGKMITWHGMADPTIMFNGTVDYFQRVLRLDPHARDFYRFFMAPGVAHCGGGAGAAPTNPLEQLVSWVETGHAPDTIPANHTVEETEWKRYLCQYPKISVYKGGNPARADSYKCE
ncbi:tannase and feruloyl esterase [Rhizodiscina lignyota]|uniref:Carboxylic ester hydrolase n=1 Tax=Rhizodiscina lignyota TaxID=1504668 RepID=A0A9P4M5B1_9PEZI|nr:tannase and feruloyl esterase [Rhizodiscina lignyota]